ncbi:MAG: PhnD/SsuA/transferrin family substrate-binding protein [Desulfoarculaceae bacterium]|nr:PhnD/SsuA/transferrin family substrate-binding protein [Desulfoarculaceae bacterium]
MNRHSPKIIVLFFLTVFLGRLSPAHGEELVFSTHPFANPAAIHKTFQPLIDYLQEETGVAIRIKIAPSYTAHIITVGSGKADLAFVGPSPYVRIKDKYGGVGLLARLRMTDDIGDKVVIVSQASAPFTSLGDLRGKTFAFGDPQSYGSHFLPRWLLGNSGVPVSALAAYDYVKSHDNVILSVLHGDFDAGGVRLDVYRKYADRALNVLAGPFLTPPHAIVCRASLPRVLQDKLRQSLLALRDPAVLERIDPAMQRFENVVDSDFDQARQVINAIEAR